MKFFFSIILSTLVFCSVNAQSKKEVKDNKIKTVTEQVSATEGGKEVQYKDSYTTFDKNGNVTEQTEYNRDGSVKKKLVIKYDSFKNKVEELEYEGAALKQKRLFTYNSNGDKTIEATFDGTGKLIKKETYEYNAKGLRTVKKVYNSANVLTETHTYTYGQ